MIRPAKIAGKSEKRDHTIVSTESVMDVGSMVGLPKSSCIMWAPAKPSKRAMSEPEMAPPNF